MTPNKKNLKEILSNVKFFPVWIGKISLDRGEKIQFLLAIFSHP